MSFCEFVEVFDVQSPLLSFAQLSLSIFQTQVNVNFYIFLMRDIAYVHL